MFETLNSLRALAVSVCFPAGIILLVHANETKWGLILLGTSIILAVTACI